MNLDRFLFEYARTRREIIARWLDPRRDATDACMGCDASWCCYQLPLAHLMEGVLVADRLQKQGRLEAELPRIQEQGLIQHGLMLEGLPAALEAINAGDLELAKELAEVFSTRWFERREPCCFLLSGRCSIYRDRPSMCSTYFVQSRCSCSLSADAEVPTLDNRDVVHWVMTLSDAAYSEITGELQMVTPLPFAYAVAAGARLLAGEALQAVASGG